MSQVRTQLTSINANQMETYSFVFKYCVVLYLTGDGWKKKWRNLRDTYMKKKKDNATKSGQAASRKKPWLFFDILTFLDEFIESPW